MYRAFYEGMSYAHLPTFALLLFMVLFGGVVLRVFLSRKKVEMDALASMPLSDDLKTPEVQR